MPAHAEAARIHRTTNRRHHARLHDCQLWQEAGTGAGGEPFDGGLSTRHPVESQDHGEADAYERGRPVAGFIATAGTDIAAPPERVWEALTDPAQIAAYMHGSTVTTTWEVGSSITWDGEFDGRPYQDRGEVLVYDEPRVLSVTHYSPMTGESDRPENYHTLVYTLTGSGSGSGTHLELTQDGCDTNEQATKFSRDRSASPGP
jgi:uncharacterized protein YndB with AHSA1/START domain